jgi:hypothetical protein
MVPSISKAFKTFPILVPFQSQVSDHEHILRVMENIGPTLGFAHDAPSYGIVWEPAQTLSYRLMGADCQAPSASRLCLRLLSS